jgi:hypothetical protein
VRSLQEILEVPFLNASGLDVDKFSFDLLQQAKLRRFGGPMRGRFRGCLSAPPLEPENMHLRLPGRHHPARANGGDGLGMSCFHSLAASI